MAKDESEGMTEKRAAFNMACTMMLHLLLKQFDHVEKKYDDIATCCKEKIKREVEGEIAETLALLGEIISMGPYDGK
jgi:hypothetical protein